MKTILSKCPHESSFSFSRRYFSFDLNRKIPDDEDEGEILNKTPLGLKLDQTAPPSRIHRTASFSKIRSAFTSFGKARSTHTVVGTLFGPRRGRARFAVQSNPKNRPLFLLEIPVTTSSLVREMASGVVRIALECEKGKKRGKLTEERSWRSYCNGKKCGIAVARNECEVEEWEVLETVGPATMGAGVLPRQAGNEGEVMYMRARFERVMGSRDSESFYMMSPDEGASGGPELSLYLLRV